VGNVRGTVFDIKRYTLHDGPGIRVSVHLKGCPLSCWWCHNPESQSFEPRQLFKKNLCIGCGMCVGVCPHGAITQNADTDIEKCRGSGKCAEICPAAAREICGRNMETSEVMDEILKELIFFEQSGGGVTISGGEPLSQLDFTVGLLEECKMHGIKTAVDTSGFADSDSLKAAAELTDLFLYDVKHMDPEKHRKYTGADNEIILSNLTKLGDIGAEINVRMPFIPGVNTDEQNLLALGHFLSGVRGVTCLSLLPYHSAAEDKHGRWGMEFKLRGVYPPTENSLAAAVSITESCGIRTVIGG
jgi:pyruvate formate lyase activating enzyme